MDAAKVKLSSPLHKLIMTANVIIMTQTIQSPVKACLITASQINTEQQNESAN